ncbi:MAG: aspartate-semialdehyde dehydrogenase [Deltaproteobacteria bacterium]|nr:aspartate-semialdehyde dehydrogenase [Deltaproteobacteria bacterium]
MRRLRVAVVGATGAVGRQMLSLLEERRFPVSDVVPLASAQSAGKRLSFGGGEVEVRALGPGSFEGVELALFSAGASVSREFCPVAAQAGALVVDNSSAWRMDPQVPLVVPEANLAAARTRPKGIIANPNCSTIQMIVALDPIRRAAGISRIFVSTYQAVSGKGARAIDELRVASERSLRGEEHAYQVFPGPMAFNVQADWKPAEGGYNEEELKMVNETRKIWGDPSIRVSPTTMRVPVLNGHTESIVVETTRKVTVAEARRLLSSAPGVVLCDEDRQPLPLAASGRDEVFVGRIREDLAVDNGLCLVVAADNLRKGAATNAIQIAEKLLLAAA